LQKKIAPKTTPKQPQNDLRCYCRFSRTAATTPRRRRRSFLIASAAFGSSWVKKGDGGLGLRWWWLRD